MINFSGNDGRDDDLMVERVISMGDMTIIILDNYDGKIKRCS